MSVENDPVLSQVVGMLLIVPMSIEPDVSIAIGPLIISNVISHVSAFIIV